MTPLYDVMSTQPNYGQGKIRRKDLKLAMAVGNSRHYIVNEILPRHFFQSAEAAGIQTEQLVALLRDLEQNAASAMERAVQAMPDDFPVEIYEPMLEKAEVKLSAIRSAL